MTQFTVRDAKANDCGRMTRMLRGEHMVAFARVGLDAHRTLRTIYNGSYYRRAILADEDLIAIGGVQGSFLDPYGYIWLAMSRSAHRFPKMLVQVFRAEIDEIMKHKIALETTVLDGDKAALRLMAFLGFEAELQGEGSRVYSAKGRRCFVRYVEGNPELWRRAGNSTAVPFLYRAEVPHVVG